MTISKALNETTLTLAIEGRLDTTTSPIFEKELEGSLEGVAALIIDMEKLEYISSAGLRVLLAAQKAMNAKGTMTVKNVSEAVNEVFAITGFSDILTIE